MNDGRTTRDAADAERARAIGLCAAGLLAVRAASTAHAPSLVDGACALGFAALVVFAGAGAHRRIAVAALAVAAGALASVPTSFDPYVSLLALPVVVGPCAALVVGAGLPASARSAALVGVAGGGALNAVAAAHQRFVTWPDALARREELQLTVEQVGRLSSLRPLGLSLSPDLYGALCLAGAAAASHLASSTTGRRRAAAIALAVACVLGAALSKSFGVALAAAVGAAVFVVARVGDKRLVLGGAAAALVVAGGAVAARGADALARSAGERIENWRAAIAILVEHPVVGVGLARFAPAYLPVRGEHANVTRYAHSFPLQWLDETGLVGGALLVVAVALVAATLRGARPILLGGAAALLARWAWDYDGNVAQTATIATFLLGASLAPRGDVVGARAARAAGLVACAACAVLVALLAVRDAALSPYGPGAAEPSAADDARLVAYAARFRGDLEAQVRAGERGDDAALRRAAATGHAPVHVYLLLADRAVDDEERARWNDAARARDPRHPEVLRRQPAKPPTN